MRYGLSRSTIIHISGVLMNRLTRLVLTICAAFAVVAAAQPAMAAYWGSSSSPLKGGGGGQGYGNFYNNSGVNAANSSQRRDSNGGGGIYVETQFYFHYDGGSGPGYQTAGRGQTERTGSRSWVYKTVTRNLHPEGTSARGIIKVCEDRNWRPDGCSEPATTTFSY